MLRSGYRLTGCVSAGCWLLLSEDSHEIFGALISKLTSDVFSYGLVGSTDVQTI